MTGHRHPSVLVRYGRTLNARAMIGSVESSLHNLCLCVHGMIDAERWQVRDLQTLWQTHVCRSVPVSEPS